LIGKNRWFTVLSHQLDSGGAMFGRPAAPQAAVAARHVRNASSRKTQSVRRDVRWRWTLKELIAASASAQTEVANPLSLEATDVTRSSFRRTDRNPNQSWRYLRLVGTQSFDLVITSLSPGGGEKMSKHGLSAGNIAALLARLSELKQKAFARTGQSFQVIVIQEAGLDGFWIHRVLQSEGVESHVVDAASIGLCHAGISLLDVGGRASQAA
jgi:hypothetical protein